MSKRKTTQVPNEEIARQYEFIEKIKEINYEFTLKNGKNKKWELRTFGCQMNENDSERIAGMLGEMGYIESDDTLKSDLIIFNT